MAGFLRKGQAGLQCNFFFVFLTGLQPESFPDNATILKALKTNCCQYTIHTGAEFPFPRTWLCATVDVINHHLHLGRHLGRSKCIKEAYCATGLIDSSERECSVSVIVEANARSAFQCCIDLTVLACKAIGLGLHNQYSRGYGRVLQMIWQSLSSKHEKKKTIQNQKYAVIHMTRSSLNFCRLGVMIKLLFILQLLSQSGVISSGLQLCVKFWGPWHTKSESKNQR